ncbi:hypothetical protein MTO96_030967 [Rhipicephalus appendiculatus]
MQVLERFLDSCSLETKPSGACPDQVIAAKEITMTLQQRQYIRHHRVWRASWEKLYKHHESQRVSCTMSQINLFKCN